MRYYHNKFLVRVTQMRKPNFLLEWCRCCSDKEVAPDRTYLMYFLFGATIEMQQMRYYHKKLLHTAANKITITITIVNLGDVWEELTLRNPSKREGCLLTSIWV